ncbi:MAG TPA: LptF/LptG family permease [Pirellulales bacterium]|jgi:lipopolysaccharide export system permease protein
MNVITRSVLLDYLLVFAIALFISVGLLLFVGASLDLPKDVGAGEIVLMLPYLLPEAVRNAMQAAALFAACSVFGRLSAGNEILALSSLGVSPLKIIRPVVLVAVFMSLACVWLYDVGESWGQRGIQQVVINSAETIALRYLRTKHSYTKGPVTLNVKAVEGRILMRPMLIVERPDHGEPITISAEEAELHTQAQNHELSLVMRNGTAYIGNKLSYAFPDVQEQIIALSDPGEGLPNWPPKFCTLSDLRKDIAREEAALAHLEQNPLDAVPLWRTAAPPGAPPESHAAVLDTEREHMHWLKAQVNRRWANGFFCLAFVMMGIPVSMRVRSRDYLTSFFACFLPVVLLNHPLHNFCIKLAESGRAPAALPWVGNVLLIGFGAWMLNRALRH